MMRYILAWAIVSLGASAQAGEKTTAVLPMGTEIPLVTAGPLSSKTNFKGDIVALKTAKDVRVEGHVVILSGSDVVGQVSDARAKGAMGMTGKLVIRPLFIRLGDRTVRLSGVAQQKASVDSGAIVGMVLLTPGFTGRSATIPQGTRVVSYVERAIELPCVDIVH